MTKVCCENCRFFCSNGFFQQGECRVHAPMADPDAKYSDVDQMGKNRRFWPVVIFADWCGEWKNKAGD